MSRQVKVGLFVIFGLVLTMVAVFLIGNVRNMWQQKVAYSAAFEDVAGLKPGAPVRMGGLDVGAVTSIGHDQDPRDTRIYVALSISKSESVRIRTDTVARVVNKGLLGDKMVELSVGSPQSPPLDPSKMLRAEEPSDMFAIVNKAAAAATQAVENLGPLSQALGDPKFTEDLKTSASDFRQLLDVMVHGNGTVHRLFYDHREADQLDELLGRLNRVSAQLDATLGDVDGVAQQVRQGPGIAHALLYDGDMSKNAAGALSEVHEDLRAIRQGNGMAHALLYGDDQSQHVMSNLNAMSDDLRTIVSGVRQGKGTIGALLVDPTVYEDIKSAVGNVERNEVLRALVRYSIKADEEHPPPQVKP